MSEHSPNLNLNLYSGADGEEKFRSFMEKLAGLGADSNMMLLDAAIKAQAEKLKKAALLDGTGKLPDSLLPEIGAEHIPFVASSLFQAAVGDASNVSDALENIGKVSADAYAHIENTNNPHGVTAEKINAVPVSRTINGQPLSDDITLSPSDIGITGKSACCIVVGTTTAGHTLNDCDYLCDGVDDQVEINQAISDNESKGYICIKLLGGTYNLTGSINIPMLSYTLRSIAITSDTSCDITFNEGNNGNMILGTVDSSIPGTNRVNRVYISNLNFMAHDIDNKIGFGIRMYSYIPKDVLIENCSFYYLDTGIHTSNTGTVCNCKFTSCDIGVREATIIEKCSFTSCKKAIDAYFTKVVANNTISGFGISDAVGIRVFSSSTKISNNEISYCSPAIDIQNANRSIVIGNSIYLTSNTANEKGIWVHGWHTYTCSNCIISNNVIYTETYASTSYPIYVQKNDSPPSSGTVGTVQKCLIANNISFGKSYYVESGLSQVYFVSNYS